MEKSEIEKIAKFILYNFGTENLNNLNLWMFPNAQRQKIIDTVNKIDIAEDNFNMDYTGCKGILDV